MNKHYAPTYLRAPQHKITIDVIGAGGTGSQVISHLSRMNVALLGLNHPGLHVRLWDDDIVSPANLGRQLFYEPDLNINKATVLITRINRAHATEWESIPKRYDGTDQSNILITCVDTAKERIKFGKALFKKQQNKKVHPYDKIYYWLDFGNNKHTGQVLLGTVGDIPSPSPKMPHAEKLNTVTEEFDLKKVKEKDQGPSCSLAEALDKQDLFINSIIAELGCQMLWQLIRDGGIDIRGWYVNLKSSQFNAIKI